MRDGEAWAGLRWLMKRQVADTFQCDNEPSGSTKYWEFLD